MLHKTCIGNAIKYFVTGHIKRFLLQDVTFIFSASMKTSRFGVCHLPKKYNILFKIDIYEVQDGLYILFHKHTFEA